MIGRCMYAGKMYETLGTRAQVHSSRIDFSPN